MTSKTKIRLGGVGIILLALLATVYDFPEAIARVGVPVPQMFYKLPFRLGLDLQGGAHLTYEADVSQVTPGDEQDALEGVRDVIERRVNAFGVAEPIVQTTKSENHWRVVVDLAGITDVNQAIRMIGETPLLDFRIQNPNPNPTLTAEQQQEISTYNAQAKIKADELSKKALTLGQDFAALAKTSSEDTASQASGGDLGLAPRQTFVPEFEKACYDDIKVGQVTTAPAQTAFGYHIIKKLAEEGSGDTYKAQCAHILVKTKSAADYQAPNSEWITSGLTGKQLKRASVAFDPTTRQPQVTIDFNTEGSQKFAELTRANIGRPIAIFLDGEAISIPTVQQEITQGQAVISGAFTVAEAKTLAQRLNAGALPVPITLVSQQTIGASLGNDSAQKSLQAGIAGLIAVALFMILVYRLPGVVAAVVLLFYVILLLFIFKLVPVTLSLAGVAGVILSLGIAVDANVLIFERLKEELRAGKPLDQALKVAFQRALPSIRDGNVSTLITCLILLFFTTSVVKGFAVTLGIGIVLSLFTSIVVTRLVMEIVTRMKIFRATWLYGVKSKPPTV